MPSYTYIYWSILAFIIISVLLNGLKDVSPKPKKRRRPRRKDKIVSALAPKKTQLRNKLVKFDPGLIKKSENAKNDARPKRLKTYANNVISFKQL
jgi:hypothetical protein